jgi:hypothetical protein
VSPPSLSVPAGGGTREFTVTADEACAWSATASEPWISLPNASGEGTRSVSVTVAANAGIAPRAGSITVEGQTVAISQDSVSCSFDVAPSEQSVSAGGGRFEARVSAVNGDCAWTARATADWIQIDRTSGTGSVTLSYTVARLAGPNARSAAIQVGGRTITVTQQAEGGQGAGPQPGEPDCTLTLSPASLNVPAGRSTAEVTITTAAGCAWRSEGLPDWIQGNVESGSGSARVVLTVAANTNRSARTAVVRVGGQSLTLTQAGAGCAYSLSTTSQNVPAEGRAFRVNVTAAAGCDWSASSTDGWLSIAPSSGAGDGTVTITAAANTLSRSRAGFVQIADQTVRIDQAAAPAPACSYTLSTTTQNVPAGGRAFQVNVTAGPGCDWRASSPDSWLTVAPSSGAGTGAVTITAAANTTSRSRAGSVQIADGTVRIEQAAAAAPTCSYSLSTTSQNVPAEGRSFEVNVTAAAGCDWRASTADSWLTVAPTGGAGTGAVTITVASNTQSASRSGSVQIAGEIVRVEQAAAPAPVCSYSLSLTSATVGVNGDSREFPVTAGPGCGWSATTSDSWIRIVSGGSGTGNGLVTFSASPNASADRRSGTIRVEGRTFNVTQDACTYDVTWVSAASGRPIPIDQPMRAAPAGDSVLVTVNTGVACTWENSRGPDWIGLRPDSHVGNGELRFGVSCNATRTDRSATMTFARRSATLVQPFDDAVSCR